VQNAFIESFNGRLDDRYFARLGYGRRRQAGSRCAAAYRVRRAIAETEEEASPARPKNCSKAPARSGDSRHVPLRQRVRLPVSQPRYAATCSNVIPSCRRLAATRSTRVVGAGEGRTPETRRPA
jgi:hypothetical protein